MSVLNETWNWRFDVLHDHQDDLIGQIENRAFASMKWIDEHLPFPVDKVILGENAFQDVRGEHHQHIYLSISHCRLTLHGLSGDRYSASEKS